MADTILAVSSATGPAERMIVRLSGPDAIRLTAARCGEVPRRTLRPATLALDGLPVPVRVLAFDGPRSATGEDVAEVHLPGSLPLVRMVVAALIAGGARQAQPGEFTRRAVANGRLDVAAAEAVGLRVAAEGAATLRAAERFAAGALAEALRPAVAEVTRVLALVESGIDFSEEDVTPIADADRAAACHATAADLRRLVDDAHRLSPDRPRPSVVLAGRPNAGKSTLLNTLTGERRAVTSGVAGTTRDLVTVALDLPGGRIDLTDAAGLEAAEDDLSRQMRDRAWQAARSADVLVRVVAVDDPAEVDLPRAPDLVVHTKLDLLPSFDPDGIGVSAVEDRGLGRLREMLSDVAFEVADDALGLTQRHVHALTVAADHLAAAADLPDAELAATELRLALDRLGEVTGAVTSDDVLGEVFATFCVGK